MCKGNGRGGTVRFRRGLVTLTLASGMLASSILPAAADTFWSLAFVNAKAVVQCPPDEFGSTGNAYPFLGVNKGKNCNWSFSSSNAHKAGLHNCVGFGASDPLKKDLKKPFPQVSACSMSLSGTLGPRVHSAVAQHVGPWCGTFNGNSGAGAITVGSKSFSLDRIRMQSQGGLAIFTASAFKPGVQKPGQAGPLIGLVSSDHDEHKLIGGIPNSSCFLNGKNLKLHGVLAGTLFGSK